jgi:hypothetical protein
MNTALEYSTRVVQEGGRRCKKSTLNALVYLTPLRIPLMNPPVNFNIFRPMYAEESRISEVPVYSPIPYAASAATGQVSRAANENLKKLWHEIVKRCFVFE